MVLQGATPTAQAPLRAAAVPVQESIFCRYLRRGSTGCAVLKFMSESCAQGWRAQVNARRICTRTENT